ncbi:hypothetical protein [Variovorax defluvii]|uniref:hypothetical protein n=1 Tax=Variovorax defluvii TaxID=913761 RepID=UPI0031E59F4A
MDKLDFPRHWRGAHPSAEIDPLGSIRLRQHDGSFLHVGVLEGFRKSRIERGLAFAAGK